jgi:hypothetical protein
MSENGHKAAPMRPLGFLALDRMQLPLPGREGTVYVEDSSESVPTVRP